MTERYGREAPDAVDVAGTTFCGTLLAEELA